MSHRASTTDWRRPFEQPILRFQRANTKQKQLKIYAASQHQTQMDNNYTQTALNASVRNQQYNVRRPKDQFLQCVLGVVMLENIPLHGGMKTRLVLELPKIVRAVG